MTTPVRHTASAYVTPARTHTPSLRTPSRAGATTPASRRERAYEIGDLVKLEGSGLVGVLRYLGPVHGRDGHYAGLELTGSSYGRGKNDGSIDGRQYFATEPKNGVFGPSSRLISLSTTRPTSATARPLSAMSGRSSRADAPSDTVPPSTPHSAHLPSFPTPSRPPSISSSSSTSHHLKQQRRTSGVPVPSSVPRAGPRKSAVPPIRSTPQHRLHGAATTTPQRSLSAPRRPASSTSTIRARPTTRQDDSFVFDDDPIQPSPAPSKNTRETLLEQLALPSANEAITDMEADHAVPVAEYERLCDELAEVRRSSTLWEEERASLMLAAKQRENELEAARRLELEDEVRRRQVFETRALELQRQLNEALDTATAAADAHDALERKAQENTDRIVDLETALAAIQLRAEHPPKDASDSTDVTMQHELTSLHTKVETMMAGWNRERSDLTDKISELQRAGNETILVFEQQLAESAREKERLHSQIRALETREAAAAEAAAAAATSATSTITSSVPSSPPPKDDSATDIDRASLQEQLAHLQTRVETLEEEAHGIHQLRESEKAAHAAAVQKLEETVQEAKDHAARFEEAAREAETRASQAELALQECRLAWERDRAELESMRETPVTPRLSTDPNDHTMDSDVIQALEARIAQLEHEKAEQHSRFTKDLAELESLVESRIFREDELETELEQLRSQNRSTKE